MCKYLCAGKYLKHTHRIYNLKTALSFQNKMTNRSCDFCKNSYTINPNIGYYKVSDNMRLSLKIDNLEESNFYLICGDHFCGTCFDVNGRLGRDSIPTIFPYKECLIHDHAYLKREDAIGRD